MSLLSNLERRARRQPVHQPPAAIPEYHDQFLTQLVQQQDDQPEARRVRPGYIHASSLLSFCPRMWRIATVEELELMEHPRAAMRVVWAMGRAAEHHVRTSVITSVGMENVIGLWTCPCRSTQHDGLGDRTRTCPRCRLPLLTYNERPVWEHDLRIVGNPDLQLWLWEKVQVVEIKSLNKTAFDVLSRPERDHVFQVNQYGRMLRAAGVPVHDTAIIFYVCKDFRWDSPYKEYHVGREELDGVIAAQWEQVRHYRAHERDGSYPARLTVCSHTGAPTAKNCPVVVSCFSRP